MTFRKSLNLDNKHASEMEQELNILLSNYRVAYLNTHGFHWLVKGDLFFNIHSVLDELYNEQIEQIDSVAERLLALGLRPVHTYEEILKLTEIAEERDTSDPKLIGAKVLHNLEVLRGSSIRVLELAQKIGDIGTGNKMEDDIEKLEKKIWMWSAFAD